MQNWGRNVKKRRSEQLHMIQQGLSTGAPLTSYPAPWQDVGAADALWGGKNNRPINKRYNYGKWLMQLFLASLLFVFTYTVFQADSSKAIRVQYWLSQSINQSFQFEKVARWYQTNWGERVSLLPTFAPMKPKQAEPKVLLQTPVYGKIVLPFDKKRKGILLQTKKNEAVVAPADGWVLFTGEKKGLGQTVILQHRDGRQTWFGFLQGIRVKEKQWVKQSTHLGQVSDRGGQSFVYVAYRKDGTFQNPTDVIPFAI